MTGPFGSMTETALEHDTSSHALPGNRAAVFPANEELLILQALRRIVRSVELHSRRLAAAWQITAPQLVCLLQIAGADGLSSRELANRVSLSPSTVVGIIDRLEARGLAERRRSAADRRVVELHVTARGHDVIAEAPSPLQEVFVRNLRKMEEGDRRDLAAALETIVGLMEVDDIRAEPLIEAGSNIDLKADACGGQIGPHTAEQRNLEKERSEPAATGYE